MTSMPAMQHWMARTQADHTLRECHQGQGGGIEIPVEPADFVILAIGIIVAALRTPHFVAGDDHRHALRQE